ncbi:hypothetical protein KFL_010970030 [Klebsormidium nitens]|uniref:Tesmin/TSO1-like CXC domain-containing protein n=1 Tax=Klebsormidium nitens TaxID=105231 RepID=A0A1Y1IP65_KLENI|nr:hypothetical protein KFL_010970030 [Klebsormidium nitens]|eukprot:GAQ92695.1 hypothetical protein KFL_010970030 [Klebsormidium nitens]
MRTRCTLGLDRKPGHDESRTRATTEGVRAAACLAWARRPRQDTMDRGRCAATHFAQGQENRPAGHKGSPAAGAPLRASLGGRDRGKTLGAAAGAPLRASLGARELGQDAGDRGESAAAQSARRMRTGQDSGTEAGAPPQASLGGREPGHTKTRVPHSQHEWGAWLADKGVKQKLINLISDVLPELLKDKLQPGQTFCISGGFDGPPYLDNARTLERSLNGELVDQALIVTLSPTYPPNPTWVVIYSPDSDVTMIGLQTFRLWSGPPSAPSQTEPSTPKQAYVQIKKPDTTQNVPDIEDVNKLATEFTGYPELRPIPEGRRLDCIAALFVLTECDKTSFFAHHSKVSFLEALCKHAEYICGEAGQTRADWCLPSGASPEAEGWRAEQEHTPVAAGRLSEVAPAEGAEKGDPNYLAQLETAVEAMRLQMWASVPNEDRLLPSFGAQKFHHERAIFESAQLVHACVGRMSSLSIEQYGYRRDEQGSLQFDYDFNTKMVKIKARVKSILKKPGCGCKVTKCQGGRCACAEAGKLCTRHCRCVECSNRDSIVGTNLESAGLDGEGRTGAMGIVRGDTQPVEGPAASFPGLAGASGEAESESEVSSSSGSEETGESSGSLEQGITQEDASDCGSEEAVRRWVAGSALT